jgi:hypothetical protein
MKTRKKKAIGESGARLKKGERGNDINVSISLIDDNNVSTKSNQVPRDKRKKAISASNKSDSSSDIGTMEKTENAKSKRQRIDKEKVLTSGN